MGDQGYMIGGYTGHPNNGPIKTFQRYDLSDNAWTSMTQSDYYWGGWGGAGAVIDGYCWRNQVSWPDPHVYSTKVQKYNISGNGWTSLSDMIDKVEAGRESPLIGSYIFSDSHRYDYSKDVWKAGWYGGFGTRYSVNGYLYGVKLGTWIHTRVDPDTLTAIAKTSIPSGISDYISSWGDDAYGYVDREENYNTSFHRYTVADDSWASKSSRPDNTKSRSSFFIQGSGHLMGGSDASSNGTTGNYRYDNASESWLSKAAVYTHHEGIGFAPPDNFAPNAPTELSVSHT